MRIPKIIHQTWKTKEIPYRTYRKTWVDSWKKYHPDWEYRLWTDDDNREFIKAQYEWFLEIYDGYVVGIQKADAIRYFLLHYYGGLYVDLDYECLKNIEPLLDDYDIVFSYVGEDRSFERSVSNAIMASVKGNSFWLHVIEELAKRKNLNVVELSTGPVVVRDVIMKNRGEWGKVKIYESKVLCPINWLDKIKQMNTLTVTKDDFKQIKGLYPDAYAVTYWAHNWEGAIITRDTLSAMAHSAKVIMQESFKLVGMAINVSYESVGNKQLWKDFRPKIEAISDRINQHCVYHVYENNFGMKRRDFVDNTEFIGFIGVEVSSFDNISEGFVSKTIHRGRYVIFTHKGSFNGLRTLYRTLYDYIIGEWLPQSGYELVEGNCFECYDNRTFGSLFYIKIDIYIPIK